MRCYFYVSTMRGITSSTKTNADAVAISRTNDIPPEVATPGITGIYITASSYVGGEFWGSTYYAVTSDLTKAAMHMRLLELRRTNLVWRLSDADDGAENQR